ncbi:PaaI family thioesterase [Actinocorallia aurea]
MSEQTLPHRAAPESWGVVWPADHGGPDFAPMIEALRLLNDRLMGADVPPALSARMRGHFERISAELAEHQVPESLQVVGHLAGPGQGQTFVPVYTVDHCDATRLRGRVTFGRYYLGRASAVHGGAITLLFDALLGHLANSSGTRLPSRTAYLNTSFRALTPIETELHFEIDYVREEGRKRFAHGRLLHDTTLCSEFEGLSIELKPGQS